MPRKTIAGKKIVANRRRAPKRAGERIRESARDLFYKRGIRAVGVDEIVTQAGVTKPSLYRSFSSKDALAADYLRHLGAEGLAHFDTVIAANPADPRGQFRIWLVELIQKAAKPDYRGCGATNAAVEYPDHKHPARKVAVGIKRRFRTTLCDLSRAMGAANPGKLGDALLLLLEGVYASGQLFESDGPAQILIDSSDILIDAHLNLLTRVR